VRWSAYGLLFVSIGSACLYMTAIGDVRGDTATAIALAGFFFALAALAGFMIRHHWKNDSRIQVPPRVPGSGIFRE
jgi:hypothetical protein